MTTAGHCVPERHDRASGNSGSFTDPCIITTLLLPSTVLGTPLASFYHPYLITSIQHGLLNSIQLP